jgi:hypothetical protein
VIAFYCGTYLDLWFAVVTPRKVLWFYQPYPGEADR